MSASRIVKFSLCAAALLIFSAAGFAQTYVDIYGFKAGNAYDEAMQINTCGSFAYKVDPPVTGVYPTQADVLNGYVFSLNGDPIPADIVGVIQFTLVNSYTVSWSIASPYKVCAVIVKGGDAARVYYYSGGATSGSGLTPPINQNNKNKKPYDVSHVTFLFYKGEQPMECWKDETAWAYGSRYTDQGNWATYTPYVSGSTVILYAGQTMNAGTVQFSAVSGGTVTITITLASGWRFAPVPENVKIQDYATAPSGNPSPGLFDWKGTADSGSNTFSIVVPANNYYGVHVDVQHRVPCPM
jgi:hypothetical protein